VSTEPEPPEPADHASGGVRERAAGLVTAAAARAEGVTERLEAWTQAQRPHTSRGVLIGWFIRYRRADGQLYALLLAAYLFVTLLPAALAMASYADSDPGAAADNLIQRLHLKGATASLVREVLSGAGGHQLTATLIAIVSVVVFGLGIGRTLQLVFGRVWGIPPQRSALVDNIRYFLWLMVFLLGCLLYVLEVSLLKSAANWVEWALAPFWLVGIAGFLAWTPVYLLHGRVTARQALPGAILCTVCLIGMRALSSIKLASSLNWYAKYYGGIGIVMAIFFWLVIATTILIVTSALSPAYAARHAEPATGDHP